MSGGTKDSASEPRALPHMREHVLAQLVQHRARSAARRAVPPLMVGVQGPQGSGKTYLSSLLAQSLRNAPHSLSVAVLSIDDLYLPHDGLVQLAASHPDNALFKGRGQPGTHDLNLGLRILDTLRAINDTDDNAPKEVQIPHFDKSLYNGEGDRVDGTVVRPPLDVVILEGWCVGFYPLSENEIDPRWELPVQGLGEDFFRKRGFRKEDVKEVNEQLKSYVSWWNRLDAFIQIKPEDSYPYTHIYKWRLQQEHNMKAKNGGKGMSDDQVEAFVDRYIPGYVFFGAGITEGGVDTLGEKRRPSWLQRGLRVEVNEHREVVGVSKF